MNTSNVFLHPTACRLHILRRLEIRTRCTVMFRGPLAVLIPQQRTANSGTPATVHQLQGAVKLC
jgi:hypothetical protein